MPSHYKVELLADNSHNDLEMQINAWFRTHKPARVIDIRFVADGAQYTYCVLILYVPKEKPLPK